MQKQKNRESKHKKSNSSQNKKVSNYTPKPRRLPKRFSDVLKSKSQSFDYILGNVFSMSLVMLFSILYFSIISQPTSLIDTGTIGFIASGAFIGSCVSSFINGLLNKFKDDFDGFSSGLFQVSLAWLSLLPIGIITGASVVGTILILLVASVVIPFTSIVYSAMGREIKSG